MASCAWSALSVHTGLPVRGAVLFSLRPSGRGRGMGSASQPPSPPSVRSVCDVRLLPSLTLCPLVSVPGRPLVVPNQEPGRGTAASPSPCLQGAVLSGGMSFRDFSSIANLGRHIHLPVTKGISFLRSLPADSAPCFLHQTDSLSRGRVTCLPGSPAHREGSVSCVSRHCRSWLRLRAPAFAPVWSGRRSSVEEELAHSVPSTAERTVQKLQSSGSQLLSKKPTGLCTLEQEV